MLLAISLLLQAVGEPTAWIDFINKVGYVGIAIVAFWALYKEHLIAGSRYRREMTEAQEDADYWRRLFESTLPLAEQAVQVAKRRG